MPQGVQAQNLWEELPFHSASTITVLSWNIRGKARSRAQPRNLLVPRVVDLLDPDVLLLQEIPSDKIINAICRQSQGRTYEEVKAGNRSEARVLYDTHVFERMPGEVNLDGMVAGVFPPEQRRQIRGAQRTFRSRMAAVRLRHRETGRVIVFLSFHNMYKYRDQRNMFAGKFCQMIAAGMEPEDTLVVGGADLNCIRGDFICGEAHIPQYLLTERRRARMIDYFVARNHDITQQGYVAARNIFNAAHFHQMWDDLNEYMRNNFLMIEADEFMNSLDHDPLEYRLTIE